MQLVVGHAARFHYFILAIVTVRATPPRGKSIVASKPARIRRVIGSYTNIIFRIAGDKTRSVLPLWQLGQGGPVRLYSDKSEACAAFRT